jgi:tRNA (guanine-N7-)-methyltransferase
MKPLPPGIEAILVSPPAGNLPFPLKDWFPEEKPVEVDAGCGKGRFLSARALHHPEIQYLGIDIKIGRIRKTSRKILRSGLVNVRLISLEISYAVQRLPASSISAFYIFFPDPWPKRRHHRRRLLASAFLASLHRALKDNGVVHIATDHTEYADHIRKEAGASGGFRPIAPLELPEDEQTDFEVLFRRLERPISRISLQKVTAP